MFATQTPGWPVCSLATARHAERELVRRSGKEWDGIHSKFNRRLCRPLARWLSKTVTTFFVAVRHRKLASRGKPSEYLNRYYHLLENDSGSMLSHFVRRVHFLLKKGVLTHYILIFSALGGLPVFPQQRHHCASRTNPSFGARRYVPKWPVFQPRTGGRMPLVAELNEDGVPLVVYNTHLESHGSERLRLLQLEEILTDASRYPPSTRLSWAAI